MASKKGPHNRQVLTR